MRPDPLEELERSPRLPSRNSGGKGGRRAYFSGRGEGREWEKRRKGWERGREEGKGKGRREGEGLTPVPDWESAKVAT